MVFSNLFVAVILEGFEQSAAIEAGNKSVDVGDEDNGAIGLTEQEYKQFCDAWAKLDTELTWSMREDKLERYRMLLCNVQKCSLTRNPISPI